MNTVTLSVAKALLPLILVLVDANVDPACIAGSALRRIRLLRQVPLRTLGLGGSDLTLRASPLLLGLEVGRVLYLIMAASLNYVTTALLLPNSLNGVAVRNGPVPLVELTSMRPRVLYVAVVLVVGPLCASDEVLLVAAAYQLVRIEILIVLAIVTVVDWVQDHSPVSARGRSLLAICGVLRGEELFALRIRRAQRWARRRPVGIDAVTSVRLVVSFETLILSAAAIEVLVALEAISLLLEAVHSLRRIGRQCLRDRLTTWTLRCLRSSGIARGKDAETGILSCLRIADILARFWPQEPMGIIR